jgi:sensor histidine kinase regulating citrate/malate metabolism
MWLTEPSRDLRGLIEITNPGTLPKNARWKLFEQGFTTSGQVEKGLGLFNVKTLTSALGETVKVDENDWKVKFTITIPEFLK